MIRDEDSERTVCHQLRTSRTARFDREQVHQFGEVPEAKHARTVYPTHRQQEPDPSVLVFQRRSWSSSDSQTLSDLKREFSKAAQYLMRMYGARLSDMDEISTPRYYRANHVYSFSEVALNPEQR
jgi:hypothetical protein